MSNCICNGNFYTPCKIVLQKSSKIMSQEFLLHFFNESHNCFRFIKPACSYCNLHSCICLTRFTSFMDVKKRLQMIPNGSLMSWFICYMIIMYISAKVSCRRTLQKHVYKINQNVQYNQDQLSYYQAVTANWERGKQSSLCWFDHRFFKS